MKILVACEESQRVCQAFRDKGHEAYSCDILPTSGDHPEWHIQGDAIGVLVRAITDDIMRGGSVWDMMIAFPPCTDLAVSGARWFPEKRADGRQRAATDFFLKIANAPIPRIAIENPIGIMSTLYRKPDQIIQPWMFGHPEQKKTCLWLKGLPKLYPTSTSLECQNNLTHAKMMKLPKRERERGSIIFPHHKNGQRSDRKHFGG